MGFFLVVMALVLLIALLAFGATGAVLLVMGLRARARAARLAETGVTTAATVVDDEPIAYRDHTIAHSPVVTFTTDEGEEVTAVAPEPSTRAWRRGAEVRVDYDSAEPEVLRVVPPGRSGSTGTLQVALGAAFVVLAVLGLVGGVVLVGALS